MTTDPKKAARAALYVARKTFADGGDADDSGVTAYHGSFSPDIKKFDKSKLRQRFNNAASRHGAWLSTNPEDADFYGPHIYQTKLHGNFKQLPSMEELGNKVKNKLSQISMNQNVNYKTSQQAERMLDFYNTTQDPRLYTGAASAAINKAKREGYDGAVLKGGEAVQENSPPGDNYVVFRPETLDLRRLKASGGMVTDPKKAARAALYVARKTFAAGGDVTDNPNFQTWFGDSVLHDNGVPRTYYTGTSKDKDFTSFNVGRHGAWFTTDPKEASQYAMENDSQGHVWEGGGYKRTNTASRVIPAHLKASNPYTGDRPQRISNSQNYKKAQSDWFDQLRAAGHDAWVPASMNGNLAVMLKHPTQIKSAIGNNGNFDPKSPHIAKATGGATDDDAFTAYHGTPHEFEPEPDSPYGRFRDTAIGSGEGAQAYGYGHYLAGNEGIAKGYQDRLAKTSDKFTRPSERIKIEGKNLNELMPNASPTVLSLISGSLEAHQGDLKSTHKTLSERGSGLSSIAAKELEPHLNKEVLYQPPYKGHLLETRVRAKPEHFLDWDKPLSEQHPHVQSAIKSFFLEEVPLKNKYSETLKGSDYYNHMVSAAGSIAHKQKLTNAGIPERMPGGTHQKLSYYLSSIGIPGIRYLDASSRGPTGAPTHNYVVFDPKNIDIVKRYAQGGEVYSNHAPRHTMQSPAVAELKHLLTTHRDELRRMKGKTQYAAIDAIMKRISREHGIAPSKLHDNWMSVYHQTPDAWVAGDHGSVVDRALKMTSRGGYALGGAPAGFAATTGAPINFAPAAGAFTGLPSPGSLNLAPSKATMAAILASRPTTRMGSGEPVKFSPYVPASISAPTFNASSYNLPKNEVSEGGQGGSGDRWHPNGGGAPTGGTAEIAAAAAAAAGPLGGGYGDSDADSAARGGRIHRADGGEAGYKETPFQHIEKRAPGWGASWTPLHEVSQKLGGIKKISESAANYGDFMNVMAHKAKNDQLSPRDLIKSYLMTVSSQGRQAVNPQTILKNWPDYPGPIHDKIRPEGAMGEWLLSPIGKRYLDAAEQGIVDHGAISHALKSFGGFGKINNAEGKALPWAAQSLVPHTKIVSDMIAASLEGRHSAEDWRSWVKNNIHGVGFAKSGFWGSMLGRGDQSVPDARQLVLHTPNKNDEATSLIGVGEGVPASQREGEAMQRIIDRQNALGLSIPKELSPHYQALAHHTIWDAAGGTDTTHQDVINAMKHAASGGAIDGDNEHPVAMIFKALGMPGLESGGEQTMHQVGDARIHRADGKKNMFRRGGSVVDHALSLTRHTALHGMQPKRGRP